MRRERAAPWIAIVGVLVLFVAITWSNYEGREHLVRTDRQACVLGMVKTAATANVAYVQSAADHLAAQLIPTQQLTGTTRGVLSRDLAAARNTEARVEEAQAVAYASRLQPSDAGLIPAALRRYSHASCSQLFPSQRHRVATHRSEREEAREYFEALRTADQRALDIKETADLLVIAAALAGPHI